jgi:hypothetical protein
MESATGNRLRLPVRFCEGVQRIAMRRHLLGILGVILVLVALVMIASSPENEFWQASCMRIGLVLMALWLAWPQLADLSRWLYWIIVTIAIVAAAFSKYAWVLIPVIIAAFVLNRISRSKASVPKAEK